MSGVLIMAGGTGGHVYPGLAVARTLRAQRVPVAWLGTRQGLEARAVPAADSGIDMEWIAIRGVRRTGLRNWLLLPFTLAYAMIQAFRVLRRRRPDVVLSMGGFVSAPGGLVAWLLRRPLLIHEQNAVPGLTNKWLALLADQVLCGFPGVLGARHVGNPVRREIAALAAPEQRLAGHTGRLRLLVVGGSQGARIFNEVVPRAVPMLPADRRPEVWHQCGRGNLTAVQKEYDSRLTNHDSRIRVSEFIDDMAAAYDWADVVLCRAGAMTVAELAASGSAAILVPYPYAVDDHQTANAQYLVRRDAAILLPQAEFTPARLGDILRELAENRELLARMARAARGCAVTDAAETVARLCLEAAHA